jgi:hypothetical protein
MSIFIIENDTIITNIDKIILNILNKLSQIGNFVKLFGINIIKSITLYKLDIHEAINIPTIPNGFPI